MGYSAPRYRKICGLSITVFESSGQKGAGQYVRGKGTYTTTEKLTGQREQLMAVLSNSEHNTVLVLFNHSKGKKSLVGPKK